MQFTTYSVVDDVNDLEKMVKWLPEYLKGTELYGNIGGGFFTGGNAPKLTLGALHLRLRRLNYLSLSLTDSLRQRLNGAAQLHEQIQQQHRSAYISKMQWEFGSRLDSMRRFFEECTESPELCPKIYQPEVLRRTICEELYVLMTPENLIDDEAQQKRRQIDSRLRALLKASEFVWPPQLMPVYPEATFWWMYMQPPQRNA